MLNVGANAMLLFFEMSVFRRVKIYVSAKNCHSFGPVLKSR